VTSTASVQRCVWIDDDGVDADADDNYDDDEDDDNGSNHDL